MSLHGDLLTQAEELSKWDPKRPRQANLRRSVSSAYYSLFHLLSSEAGSAISIGSELRPLVQRALQHAVMRQACKSFGGGTLPTFLRAAAPAGLSENLKQLARIFIELQQARHEADYNVSKRFLRKEVQVLLSQARQAFEIWLLLPKEEQQVFLLSLLLWKQWEHLRQ